MDIRHEILINQIVQDIKPLEVGLNWFDTLDENEQRDVLRAVNYMAIQAHPTKDEALLAITISGLKSTYTPCVLLIKSEIPKQGTSKILNLPASEFKKSFKLLVALLRVADTRRRLKDCHHGCSHWWHQDLSDSKLIEGIMMWG